MLLALCLARHRSVRGVGVNQRKKRMCAIDFVAEHPFLFFIRSESHFLFTGATIDIATDDVRRPDDTAHEHDEF